MKTIYKNITLTLLGTLALMSCEKDEERVIATLQDVPALTASRTTLLLREGDAAQNALTINWTPVTANWSDPNVAPNNAVKYSLQLDEAGGDFSRPVAVALSSGTSRQFTVQEFNTILVDRMGLTPFVETTIDVRVRAYLGNNIPGTHSNVISLRVTPYEEVVVLPIYMVGSATPNAWDAANATPMFINETAQHQFTYTGKFNAGDLKFLKTQGQWAPMWGNDGSGTGLTLRETEADSDPASFAITTEGYYTVTIDTAALTYAIAQYNASASLEYTSIGIIGAFSDWNTDVAMTQSSFDPHQWSRKDFTLDADSELKFRKAGDWGVNWGTNTNRDRLYGIGGQDQQNLIISAGTYDVYFNDLTGRYLFVKK